MVFLGKMLYWLTAHFSSKEYEQEPVNFKGYLADMPSLLQVLGLGFLWKFNDLLLSYSNLSV